MPKQKPDTEDLLNAQNYVEQIKMQEFENSIKAVRDATATVVDNIAIKLIKASGGNVIVFNPN